ncbi:YIP1 family protein [Salinibius halmophilus]|uniref:YIP1 family protein n=1 Tax=Salinibius halmophilus TaxID=1853216 RepID=UPI000E672C7E|nr:YIP1 family protein [Salinibius halmophilus]
MSEPNPYQTPEAEPTNTVVTKHKYPLLSSLLDVFIAPNKVMSQVVKGGYGWWLPTLILMIAMAAPLILHPLSMTSGQYVEMQVEQLEAMGQEVTSDVVAGIQMTADFAVWMNLVGIIIFPIVFVISALYYWLAGLVVAEDRPKFSMAYNLTVWSMMPVVFTSLLQVINIQLSGAPLNQFELDPTTFSNLLALPMETYAGALAATLNPFSIWAMVLAFLGFRYLNGGGTVSAVIVAFVLPLLLSASIAAIPFAL